MVDQFVISTGVSRERWLFAEAISGKVDSRRSPAVVQLIKGKDYVHGRPKNEWQGEPGLLYCFPGRCCDLACCFSLLSNRRRRNGCIGACHNTTFNGARAFGNSGYGRR